jgi:glutathione S-transferase
MSQFTVYGIPGSPYVRAVQMGLEEKGAAYRLHALDFGESKTPQHLERHPFGRVPAFEHGNFRLYETQAILRYLDDVIPEPRFEPADPQLAARMNQIIGINDSYLYPKTTVIVVQRIIGPLFLGRATDESAITAVVPQTEACIAELERLLGSQSFMAGEQLSIADLMLAPNLDNLAATPEGKSLLGGTRLATWLARMNTRPSMIATRRRDVPQAPLRGQP